MSGFKLKNCKLGVDELNTLVNNFCDAEGSCYNCFYKISPSDCLYLYVDRLRRKALNRSSAALFTFLLDRGAQIELENRRLVYFWSYEGFEYKLKFRDKIFTAYLDGNVYVEFEAEDIQDFIDDGHSSRVIITKDNKTFELELKSLEK